MGSGFKTFNSGDVLTAAQVQGYLQDQAVMYFANATARDAAVTSPTEGMACYLADTNYLQLYDGSAWSNVITAAGVPAGVSGAKQLVTFTSSGTFTKASYSSYSYAEITVVGGGGAGGGADGTTTAQMSAGSGGGAGGTGVVVVALSAMAASETVTVGVGGTGVSADHGGNGASSSFGTWAVATGGSGGIFQSNGAAYRGEGQPGGAGGIGTTGTLLMQGSAGGAMMCNEGEMGFAGGGGLSSFGGSGYGMVSDNSPMTHQGADGPVPGAGGDGSLCFNQAVSTDLAGGDGADGIVVVKLT